MGPGSPAEEQKAIRVAGVASSSPPSPPPLLASSSPHHRTEPIQPINSHCRYHQVHLPKAYSSGTCESFASDMINVKPKGDKT